MHKRAALRLLVSVSGLATLLYSVGAPTYHGG
jgi:hypothetical protein